MGLGFVRWKVDAGVSGSRFLGELTREGQGLKLSPPNCR